MEKLYSVIHSTFVLCLFLGILLLGRATVADRDPIAAKPKTLAQENKWEGLEVSPPFSWPSLKSMVGLNLLPIYQEEQLNAKETLHQPVSFTQPIPENQTEGTSHGYLRKLSTQKRYLQ